MPPSRAIMDGGDAPVARSYSPGILTRRTPVATPAQHPSDKKRRFMKHQRRQEEDEDEQEDDEGVSSDSSSRDNGEATSDSGEESGAGPADEGSPELTPAQERLRASSPFADFEVPTVADLGALPMPPLNTRRSMRPDKIKRRSRRSLSPRQEIEKPSSSSDEGPSDGEQSSESELEGEAGDAAITSTSNPGSVATITGGASRSTIATVDQSTFIAAADPTGGPTPAPDSAPTESGSLQQSGPAPESHTAIIAGTTILGVAVVVTLIYLLFRFCVPVRTWWLTRTKKHRDDKATRLGTAPSPWKWPLQFIFGSDRPAPPRRKPQNQQQHAPAEYYDKDAFDNDLESQAPNTPSTDSWPVADGFRGPQNPPDYKSHTTTSGTSWVANGWRAPVSHISERLSNWPRRSGTARWFFGGGASSSRWSDSDNGARTTCSEGQLVSMYGQGTAVPSTTGHGRRSSIAKSPLQQSQVQVSEVEVTPPLPTYSASATKTTVLESPSPPGGLGNLTQTPIRARASPRNTYMTRSSVATTATTRSTGPFTNPLPPPTVPYANYSHFSATTIDPSTPRHFISGLPSGVPEMPSSARRNSSARFPVGTSSVSSVSSRGSRSSIRSGSGITGSTAPTAPTTATRGSDKPLPVVGLSRGSSPQMI